MQIPALFTALLLLFSINAKAQADSAFEKKISGEMCREFENKKASFSAENYEMQVGLLLVPIFVKYTNEFKTLWQLDYQDDAQGEVLGERLGLMLVTHCPSFTKMIMEFEMGKEENTKTKTASGVLVQIENQQPFTCLIVKSSNGKPEKIWWLEYFAGSDKLQANAATYLNKPITISYKEVEWFDAVNNDYKTYKVAVALK